jgi:dual specificity phosphatase 12
MFQAEINAKKENDDDNPFSVDEIEPRLWLGNVTAASNLNFLKSKNISHILTIESFPLPTYVSSQSNGKLFNLI